MFQDILSIFQPPPPPPVGMNSQLWPFLLAPLREGAKNIPRGVPRFFWVGQSILAEVDSRFSSILGKRLK